jgi:hypothetical protein
MSFYFELFPAKIDTPANESRLDGRKGNIRPVFKNAIGATSQIQFLF